MQIMIIMNKHIYYFNATKCQMVIYRFKPYKLKIFRFKWYKFFGLNKFICDQVIKFNQYKLQGFVFNELVWLQLVDVDKH